MGRYADALQSLGFGSSGFGESCKRLVLLPRQQEHRSNYAVDNSERIRNKRDEDHRDKNLLMLLYQQNFIKRANQ